MSSSSSNYEQFAHLQIPLEEIVSATDNFSDANHIRTVAFGKEYQGKLLRSGQLVDIVARRLAQTKRLGDKQFWMEVSMLSRLEHPNIVSIVGFCDEDGEKIVIYKGYCTNLYDNLTDSSNLTWMRRLEICVGVARALSYIHYDYDEGRDFSVIHRDIRSYKIFLDKQCEPRLSGFEHSITQASAERNSPCQLTRDDIWGAKAYIDPTYYKRGCVSHKSDIFSFGVVLIEVLCGKCGAEPVKVTEEGGEMYLYDTARSHYRAGKLYDLVDPVPGKQMSPQSFTLFSETAYDCLKKEPSKRPSIDQVVVQLEKALKSQTNYRENDIISDDYSMVEGTASKSLKQFGHLKIRLKEILSATDHFSDSNIIGRKKSGWEYKGKLLQYDQVVNITAWRLYTRRDMENKEFLMEVMMLSTLKHRNIATIVGFCEENGEKIVINKHETHGSLDQHLKGSALTWMQRLQICVGVAHALSYIYYDKGRDFSILHCDIKSAKILLDDNWEAKLSGFELSMTQTTSRRDRLCLTDVCGTMGYCDPISVQSGSMTHKSDIYSFGIVMFEVLCGKEATTVENDNSLSASSARSHYEGERLKDMIDPVLWKQMNSKSIKIFSETAYYCMKEQRPQRPNIYQIIRRLEDALKYQREHDNHLISKANDSMVDASITKSLKEKGLKHLEIPLPDIMVATKDFNHEYLIGSGGYGEVYKAELDHFDSEKLFPSEEKNISERPKKRSIVAIKRIKIREDEEGEKGFLAEIEMLSSCKHPNIVSLLGFCEEGRDMILVYEHASKGSLNDYLGRTDKLTNLSWLQRLKISIDVARGLNYLHTKLDDKRRIIHRDIKSDNILLSENWVAKIADFGLSKFRPENQQVNNTIYTRNIAGTELYLDPEYLITGKLKNESDIYSLGVVLFEILSGRLANDAIYINEDKNGIAHVARRRFKDKTIREMVDPRLLEETHEYIFTLNRGPDQDSLKAVAEIAYLCVAESQAERPSAEVVLKKLEEALSFQESVKDQLKFSVKDIALATQSYSVNNLIGSGGFGQVYKGEVTHAAANGRNVAIAAKRMHMDQKYGEGEPEFLAELQVLLEYKHENIIGLVGYCNEMDERIIVYEYAARGSLDYDLRNNELTWRKRLEICIDIASGLHFLHGGSLTQDVVIHRDIKSANVLLNYEWKAKISDFGISLISPINKDMDFVIDAANGTPGYIDPLYRKLGFLTKESDIYSLGVVLFEIFSGRCGCDVDRDKHKGLTLSQLVKRYYKKGKLDKMVFEGIKEQIAPKSFTTFVSIAYQCLNDNREERPKTGELLLRLKQALKVQEDYDIWKPKVPKDYEDLIQMSNSREINYSTDEMYKDLYDVFSKGILLKEGKVLFSVDANGERNEMISAMKFSYKRRWSLKWQSIPESRFHKVAMILLDISNLKIQIKIKPQFLSPEVNYGVYLVFKFCGPRKSVAKRMYVNLKYKKGRQTLHAYFATWREDGWMMIELCQFLNDIDDTEFEFLLESFSRCYCQSHGLYIEGIEFRAIENVKHEESKNIEEVQLVQELSTNSEFENQGKSEELLSENKVNKKKTYMLSAKEALYQSSDPKLYNFTLSDRSRSEDPIELLSQQVFRIKCKIECKRLSRNTEYACYLVFKLSENCRGLHCPVIVRDLLQRKNKQKRILYFRSPSPCNVNDTDLVPEERKDGWMEVNVWQFSLDSDLQNDSISINLKLISYEGTMSGLIISGLEFRPL